MRPWLVLGTLALGTTLMAQDAPPAPPVTAQLKVPVGFKAVPGTVAEPYTDTGWAQEIVHEQTGMPVVYIPAGEFQMGSPPEEAERSDKETQHQVKLTKGFYLGKYEVTQEHWERAMGGFPVGFKKTGGEAPMEQVSWDDCQALIKKLNATLPPPKGDKRPVIVGFRLPTEAEWEYACRAGTKGPFHYGDSLDATQANCNGVPYGTGLKSEPGARALPVGSFLPNAWGLYDMHGDVWEWCADWFGDYPTDAVTNPTGPETGTGRVARGGSRSNSAAYCRSAFRIKFLPTSRNLNLGCRLAITLP